MNPAWLLPSEVAARLGITKMGVFYRVTFERLPALRFCVRGGGRLVTRIEARALDPSAPSAEEPPVALTTRSLAEWLRVNPGTVRRLRRDGKLIAHFDRPTSSWVYSRRAVLAFLVDHATTD